MKWKKEIYGLQINTIVSKDKSRSKDRVDLFVKTDLSQGEQLATNFYQRIASYVSLRAKLDIKRGSLHLSLEL